MLQSALEELDRTRSQLVRCSQENTELKQMLVALQENQRMLEVILCVKINTFVTWSICPRVLSLDTVFLLLIRTVKNKYTCISQCSNY